MLIWFMFNIGVLGGACGATQVPQEPNFELIENTTGYFGDTLESTTINHFLDGDEVPTPYSTNSSYIGIAVTATPKPLLVYKSNSSKPTEQQSEQLYLVYEYEGMDKETFWRNNSHECINGTLQPSSYLRMKYKQCEKIHAPYNPQCTKNCEMAITMLLGPVKIPTPELFKRFSEITLPESLHKAAIRHYTNCFEKFGKNEYLLDNSCRKSQNFFACIQEFQSQMICNVEKPTSTTTLSNKN